MPALRLAMEARGLGLLAAILPPTESPLAVVEKGDPV